VNGWAGLGLLQPANPYQVLLTGAGFCSGATPTRAGSWGTLKSIYR
jgi:hypothetical protein